MRENRYTLIIALIIVLVLSFIGGYFVAALNSKNEKTEAQNTSAKAAKFYKPEELISSNTKILIKKNYTQDGIVYNEEIEEKPSAATLGMDRSDAEKYYKTMGYNLLQFSSLKVILAKDVEALPPGRFVLKINSGVLSIYEIGEKNELILKEDTDISIDSLTEEDRAELTKGRVYDSLDEVYLMIEEYSS